MFYSESLLSKKGPLARVWLAANLERKLSKAQFLQTSIEKSVGAIVGDDVAPMALRLSGQLLLGVVRIYSRKAKYLLDDCNEALLKLRMTFSKGNVDLVTGPVAANPQQLTLPNAITELDLLLPDPSITLGFSLNLDVPATQATVIGAHTSNVKDITLPELQDSIELARGTDMDDELANIGDDELILDTGEFLDGETSAGVPMAGDEERHMAPIDEYVPDESIEIGRQAEGNYSEIIEDYGVEISRPDAATPKPAEDNAEGGQSMQLLDDMELLEMPSLRQEEDETLTPMRDVDLNRAIRRSAEPDANEPTKKTRAPTKRKLKIDTVTELKSAFIKDMQNNRTGIIKNYAVLPFNRESVTMFKAYETTGVFDIIFKPAYMHRSLSKIVSPEFLQEVNSRKRKASAEIPEGEDDDLVAKKMLMDKLELIIDEDNEVIMHDDEERYQGPIDEYAGPEDQPALLDLEFEGPFLTKDIEANEVVTSEDADLVEDGLEGEVQPTQVVNDISRHTKETVVILQQELSRTDTIDFQSLTGNVTRQQAVKLFFETLVLATKDAVEVDQKTPFGDIEIKAKDALFHNDWFNASDEKLVEAK
ncbi:Rec8 like protein-domain-containing protein [Lipomyces kononenkoae]|uniref:Rec8 like protein-domain-containing protein n=1 Tax=Lipomyces kononenkoae TaxID=34357 RepID=A0ACC3SW75_LIPKO